MKLPDFSFSRSWQCDPEYVLLRAGKAIRRFFGRLTEQDRKEDAEKIIRDQIQKWEKER